MGALTKVTRISLENHLRKPPQGIVLRPLNRRYRFSKKLGVAKIFLFEIFFRFYYNEIYLFQYRFSNDVTMWKTVIRNRRKHRTHRGGTMNVKILPYIILVLLLVLPSQGNSQDEEVGITEQLGKTLPLELTFKDSNGKEVTLKELIDKPTVLSLVYYHCPTVCKPLLGAKTDVLDRIDLVPGKDYKALTISFNEDETPENAKTIKDHFLQRSRKKIPPEDWHFLTGDKESIKKLTDTVGFHFKRDGQDFIHPTGLIMISPQGKITRYFNGLAYLPFDIKLGLLEASEGKVGPTISKILLYCFRYDPEGKRYVFDILKVTGSVTLFFLAIFISWLLISNRRKRKRVPSEKHRDQRENIKEEGNYS
jgi:protein SCO1